ncbi:hypothetical protein PGTUg99_035600 [Puccinia graminis f. sp. tritici]|uniref:Uncharacterized protein n=1 Tax=Puccinia graminis f. sp. tritici TaxID=56615 RepID=A0A5B0RG49_PUCGR|nr:hypothetical protein PGTUg99_035600 [Puccinia graminis f. sp. tritici]
MRIDHLYTRLTATTTSRTEMTILIAPIIRRCKETPAPVETQDTQAQVSGAPPTGVEEEAAVTGVAEGARTTARRRRAGRRLPLRPSL